MSKLHAWLVAVAFVILAVLLIGIYTEERTCSEKGGKRLRGTMLESFKCYERSSLKVLP
jgi:hypothetical protein